MIKDSGGDQLSHLMVELLKNSEKEEIFQQVIESVKQQNKALEEELQKTLKLTEEKVLKPMWAPKRLVTKHPKPVAKKVPSALDHYLQNSEILIIKNPFQENKLPSPKKNKDSKT